MFLKLLSAGVRTALLPVSIAADAVKFGVEATGAIEPSDSITERQWAAIIEDIEEAGL